MYTDILPRRESDKISALTRITDVCASHRIGDPVPTPPAWDWISVAELAAFKEIVEDTQTKFQQHVDQRSPASKAAKDAQFAIVIPMARKFIKKNLTQEQVGPEGRTELGLPLADTVRTPAEIPATPPEGYSVISGEIPGVVRVRYRGGKPAGVVTCEIRYGFAPAVPSDPETLIGAETFSHNPWSKTFLNDRGKTLYYALRWVVSGSKFGDWSDMREVIVP